MADIYRLYVLLTNYLNFLKCLNLLICVSLYLMLTKTNHKPKQNKACNAIVSLSCINCKVNYFLQNFETFLKLMPFKRLERVKQLKLCINYLRKVFHNGSHQVAKPAIVTHNTVLHFDGIARTQSDSVIISIRQEEATQASHVNMFRLAVSKLIILKRYHIFFSEKEHVKYDLMNSQLW